MEMKGWDTISFLRTEVISQQFADAWQEDMGQFQYSDGSLTIQGCFGPPKIISGGSGKALRVSLPIVSGTAAAAAKQYALNGCECCIAVMLQLIPEEDSQTLWFNLRQLAKSPEEAGPDDGGWVIPIAFHDPESNVPRLRRQSVLECVCQYLIEHPGFFRQLLASVTMRQREECSWAAPENCTYAYLDSMPPRLCILGICDIQRQSDLPISIDPPSVSAGAASCLAVSSPLFLSNTFIPALDEQFPDIIAGAFEPQDGWLQNIFPLNMAPLTCQGQEYAPTAETIRLKIAGSQIVMVISGSCDLDPIDAELEFTLDIRFSLTLSGQTALFQVVSKNEQHAVHSSSFFDIPIVSGLVKLLLKELSGSLIRRLGNTLSSSRILLNLDAVNWLGRKNSRLLSARLENCLLLEYEHEVSHGPARL